MATDRYGKYTCTSLTACISFLTSTLERQNQHTAITDMKAMVLHGVAAHCNHIFYQIFLHVIICKFRLRISMNYMENVAELLAHVQTVDIKALLSNFCQAPGNEATPEVTSQIV